MSERTNIVDSEPRAVSTSPPQGRMRLADVAAAVAQAMQSKRDGKIIFKFNE